MNSSLIRTIPSPRNWTYGLAIFVAAALMALAPAMIGGKSLIVANIVSTVLAVDPDEAKLGEVVTGGQHRVTLGTEHFVLRLDGTPDDVIQAFGLDDQASYAKGGKLISEGVRPERLLRIWAPGMMAIEAAVIAWWPGPFVEAMVWLTALVWAVGFAISAGVLRQVSASRVMPLSLFLFFLLKLFVNYFLLYGVLLSESLSIALFLPAVLLLCMGLSRHNRSQWLAATLLMVAATMIRAQFLLVMQATLLLLLAYSLCTNWVPALRRQIPDPLRIRDVMGVVLLYALPIVAYSLWNHGGFVHTDYYWNYAWRPTPDPPDYMQDGGMGVLCQIDPGTCQSMQSRPIDTVTWQDSRMASIHSILAHPFALLAAKLPYFINYFMMAPWGSGHDYPGNTILALAALAGIGGSMLLGRRDAFFQILLIVQLGTWAGSLVLPMTFMDFEGRYLFIGKAMGFISFLAVASELFRLWQDGMTKRLPKARTDETATEGLCSLPGVRSPPSIDAGDVV